MRFAYIQVPFRVFDSICIQCDGWLVFLISSYIQHTCLIAPCVDVEVSNTGVVFVVMNFKEIGVIEGFKHTTYTIDLLIFDKCLLVTLTTVFLPDHSYTSTSCLQIILGFRLGIRRLWSFDDISQFLPSFQAIERPSHCLPRSSVLGLRVGGTITHRR